MKFLIILAWKNLSRYRRRTLITAIAIAFGLGLFIWIDSMLLGMDKESERNFRWYETGSAKVILAEYEEEMTKGNLEYLIPNPAAVSDLLAQQNIPHTYRASFAAEAIVDNGSLFVRATALNPETDNRVYRIKDAVSAGRFFEAGEFAAVLGDSVADSLDLEVGDFISLRTRTAGGYNQTLDMEVVGLVDTPNPFLDRGAIMIPLDVADEVLFLNGGVTEIALDIPATTDVAQTVGELNTVIQAAYPGLKVLSWTDLAKDFLALAEAKSSGTSMILFFVFIIAAVGISNTMLMAIFERIREIGMMRAQGMKDRQIQISFLLESAGIGLIGSLGGVILGVILNFWIIQWGIDFSTLIGDMDIGYRTTGVMYGAWNFDTIITAFFLGIIIAVVVALIPTRNAIRMKITDALRHN